MANSYFQFKQFTIHQNRCAMKVTTDGCLFGAWMSERVRSQESGVESRESEEEKGEVKSKKVDILDIGTGTGLLSLMVAQAEPHVHIDAVEIEEECFEQAWENFNASPWPDRINAIHGDASAFIFTKQYDVITSNPPFYENELKSPSIKKNKAHHDEGLLLDDLLAIIQKNLNSDGSFYLLFPYKRNKEVENAIAGKGLFVTHKTLVRQSTRHDYFRIMISGTHFINRKDQPVITELAIRNEKNQYTPDFIHLLKDYYLHL